MIEKEVKVMGMFLMLNILHLKLVWKEFRFKTFKDFHNHYLKKDVLLLAELFEKFISVRLKYYNLDPWHYFSAPG